MAKDALYFKFDANAHDDLKIKVLRNKYGWGGYGWFWFIISQLRTSGNYELEYSTDTFEALSVDMGVDENKVKEYIDFCISRRLFINEDGVFYSPRLNRDMEAMVEKREHFREQQREKGYKSAEKRYGKDYRPGNDPARSLQDETEDLTMVKPRLEFGSTESNLKDKRKEKRIKEDKRKENKIEPPIVPLQERGTDTGRVSRRRRRNTIDKSDPDRFIKGKYGHLVQRHSPEYEEAQELWDKTLEIIKTKVSDPNFRTWFEKTRGYLLAGDQLTVIVPSENHIEYISKHQITMVRGALNEIRGSPIDIKLVVGKEETDDR